MSRNYYKLIPVLVFISILNPEPTRGESKLNLCNGIWTNGNCDGGSIKSLEASSITPEVPQAPAQEARAALKTPIDVEDSVKEISVRRRILERDDPLVVAVRENTQQTYSGSQNRRSVFLRIKGQGKILVKGELRWGFDLKSKKPLNSKRVEFAPKGEEREVEFSFELPASANLYRWNFTAINQGPWDGYLDLTGCCSWHGGLDNEKREPICNSDGKVMCSDKEESPTCRCE